MQSVIGIIIGSDYWWSRNNNMASTISVSPGKRLNKTQLESWQSAHNASLPAPGPLPSHIVKTVALITWFLYLIHSSFHFLCTCTRFGLFHVIRIHFLPSKDQTNINCCITATSFACNRPDCSSVFLLPFLSDLVSQWLPLLAPTHAVAPVFPLEVVSLLFDPGAS